MDEPKRNYTTNEEAQFGTRVIAVIFLAIGFAIAYWVWPAGATDTPLGSMTFGTLLQAIGSVAIAFLSVVGFFLLWI